MFSIAKLWVIIQVLERVEVTLESQPAGFHSYMIFMQLYGSLIRGYGTGV